MNETEQRLENLEIKLMDLENSLVELNNVVIRQSGEIKALQQLQQRLHAQLETHDSPNPGAAVEPPPPHY